MVLLGASHLDPIQSGMGLPRIVVDGRRQGRPKWQA